MFLATRTVLDSISTVQSLIKVLIKWNWIEFSFYH
jgi:hypothetical protein